MSEKNVSIVSYFPLGTSAGLPTKDKNMPAALLEFSNGDCALIDCADAVNTNLEKLGINYERIKLVAITHLHSDHFPGLLSFVHILNAKILLPKGGKELIETYLRLTNMKCHSQLIELPKVDRRSICTMENGTVIDVITLPHSIPSYGFIFTDSNGFKFCALGDTGGRDLKFLGKINVLVHEATRLSVKWDEHSNVKTATDEANDVSADMLLLTHFSRKERNLDEFIVEAKKHTKSKVLVVKDFHRIFLKKEMENDVSELSNDTIIVENLSYAVNNEELMNMFTEFNPISATVITNRNGKSKGFGFVQFGNEEEQLKAIRAMNGTTQNGRVIKVLKAKKRV